MDLRHLAPFLSFANPAGLHTARTNAMGVTDCDAGFVKRERAQHLDLDHAKREMMRSAALTAT
jgi:hypothetical protein